MDFLSKCLSRGGGGVVLNGGGILCKCMLQNSTIWLYLDIQVWFTGGGDRSQDQFEILTIPCICFFMSERAILGLRLEVGTKW